MLAGTRRVSHTEGDSFRQQAWVDVVATSVRDAGAPLEVFEYPGSGHLFIDASLPAEHQPDETELSWQRVLGFGPLAGGELA